MTSQKVSLDMLATVLPSQINVFICSASFENRSTVIAKQLQHNTVEHALIFANQVNFTQMIDITAGELSQMFGSRGTILQISMDNPLTIADRFQEELKKISSLSSVTYVIDITSFTHEALLIILRVLVACVKPIDKIICLYNGASEYSLGLPPEDKWLSKGVREIRSVLGYSGQIVPTQKTHLIVLVGFETERAERIIAAYEPNELSLGYGSLLESISPPLYDLNKKFHKKLSAKYRKVSEFTFSCDDAIAAKTSVIKQADLLAGFNVFVAPMNTKISTVGVALAAFEKQTIQLCYASAERYNFEAYSTPRADCYLFEIPLSTSANG